MQDTRPNGVLPPFAVREARAGDEVRIVVVAGELDMATVDELERVLVEVESTAPDLLVLDLRDVEFIGSLGLRLLIGAKARADGAHRELEVLPSRAVQKILDVTGTSEQFDLRRPIRGVT